MKKFEITEEEIALIRRRGGASFRPLHRGKFRCNQLPGLGMLSRSQTKRIKSLCGARVVKFSVFTPAPKDWYWDKVHECRISRHPVLATKPLWKWGRGDFFLEDLRFQALHPC